MKKILKLLLGLSILGSSTLFAMKNQIINTKHSQDLHLKNGYKAIIGSLKPLTKGKNNLAIIILKNNKFIENADVNIIFALPTLQNMEFSEHALEKNNYYNVNLNFKEKGEWEYELMFKTKYGAIYSKEGRITVN